jgi:class 3 adenylate cyclase
MTSTSSASEVLDVLRSSQVYDYIRVSYNVEMRKFLYNANKKAVGLKQEPEAVQFADNVTKINRKNKKQERALVITNKAIYNYEPNKFSAPKRRILINQLKGLIMSRCSDEIVFQVEDSYDYRYVVHKRKELLEMLNKCYEKENQKQLNVLLSEEKELNTLVTTKDMIKLAQSEAKSKFHLVNSPSAIERSVTSHTISRSPVISPTAANRRASMNSLTRNPINKSADYSLEFISAHNEEDIKEYMFKLAGSLAEGWLTKKKGKSDKWERKYFILTNTSLQYFQPRIKGNVQIDSSVLVERNTDEAEEIETEGVKAKNSVAPSFKPFRIKVSSQSRKSALHIAAENEFEMQRWMSGFSNRGLADEAVHNHIEGWLMKRDPTSKTWRKRYFILIDDRCWYFEMINKGNIDLVAGVSAHQANLIQPTEDLKHNFAGTTAVTRFAYRWNVTDTSRIFNLSSDSEADMKQWIEAVEKASREHTKGASAESNRIDLPEELLSAIEQEAPSNQVTFVFTDVQSSTTLWEKVPDAMDSALEQHDRILRELLRKYNGYEVKTEGDAFMVTFFTALDALLWCCEVQHRLVEAEWHEDLLQMPSAKKEFATNPESKVETVVFNGIRIRMGVHTGYPNCRRNPVTGRMDYFGPVVNRSARVSDTAHGGQIVATQEVMDILFDKGRNDPRFFNFPIISDAGAHSLKGINEPVKIFQVMPQSLALRQLPPLRTENNDNAAAQNRAPPLYVKYQPSAPIVPVANNNHSSITSPAKPPANSIIANSIMSISPSSISSIISSTNPASPQHNSRSSALYTISPALVAATQAMQHRNQSVKGSSVNTVPIVSSKPSISVRWHTAGSSSGNSAASSPTHSNTVTPPAPVTSLISNDEQHQNSSVNNKHVPESS